MHHIKDFKLPPHKIMYTVPRKREKKVLFMHMVDQTPFHTFSEVEQKALKKCKIEFAFENKWDAVRASLGNKVNHLTDDEIKKRYPHYEKYAFPLQTDSYLLMTKKEKTFILVDNVLHRSVELYKRCTLCREVLSAEFFKKGGKCNDCINRIKSDKQRVRNTILKYVNEKESLLPLFGKNTWQIDVSKEIIEKLEMEGLAEQGENEAYMLYDVADLERENIDLETILGTRQGKNQ